MPCCSSPTATRRSGWRHRAVAAGAVRAGVRRAASTHPPAHGYLFSRINTTRRIHMKAIVYPRYGSPDVVQLKEVEQPVPKDAEVLVKVQAASVNALDWHFMRGSPFLVRVS